MGQKQPAEYFSYRHGEARTKTGQLVKFTYVSDTITAVEIEEFLRTKIRTIDIPTTTRVNGGYGQYTRYDITQHDYAGGTAGYIEVLEIKNPPDNRWGIIINECASYKGSQFTEWETVESARAAFAKLWKDCGDSDIEMKFPNLPGFKRHIVCGRLTPWFYAIGNEQLIGDYAFPEGLQDDAVYRFGRQFVVFDYEGIPTVKICMGTRFVKIETECYPYNKTQFRLVYWDDGSVWNENDSHGEPPRPLEENEVWITEAIQQFKNLLAGKSTKFTINFTDGNKFVGKLVRANRRVPCGEGDYFLVVRLKDKKKPVEGWVNDFKPTKDAPDIVQFVTQRYQSRGYEVEHVEVKECKTEKGGKKWSGVFFHRP